MKKLNSIPLHKQAKKVLLDYIQTLQPSENKLPSEEDLARELGISRATVREALASLIREGIVTRKQGKGNFAHPNILNLKMRMDLQQNFLKLLEWGGYTPSLKVFGLGQVTPPPKMGKRMAFEDKDVYLLEMDYYADGHLAIVVHIYIPFASLSIVPEGEVQEESLEDFCKKYGFGESAQVAIWLGAEHNEQMAGKFQLALSTAFVTWEEVFYDLNDDPTSYSLIYFQPDLIDLSLAVQL
jgi:GntR family transcriptional regulator